MEEKKREKGKSYYVGIVALVFLIIGYQTALFVHKAAVAQIVSHRDSPDTVYVYEQVASGKKASYGGDKASYNSKKAPSGGNIGRTVPSSGMETRRSEHSQAADKIYKANRRVESFVFNPNTVSVEDLIRLGFSEKQAGAIDSYRTKGGRFRRKADFAKSFVVADSVYRRLEPYIDIPLVDLNQADSAALDDLPGIGGYFAKSIIAHRTAIGGFTCKEQLLDVKNMDKERYDALADLVFVNENDMKPLRLWTMPEDSLRLHPYIGKKYARGIVLYREHNPPESLSVDGLLKAGVIDEETAVKLSRCLIPKAPD
ncbi:MAG: helix-hairpin-helix domain-containing protein [Candidatus Cryptobacteroides sp.]